MQTIHSKIKEALLGVAVGDALGVPVEFTSRSLLQANPVTAMRGYGTHRQPAGTWSDDSSLTFCLAETLAEGFALQPLGGNFVRWLHEAWWTPHGEVFDVGIATQAAIGRLARGTAPELAGGFEAHENGNGSLMRILPLVFYLAGTDWRERWQLTKGVSSLTHGHIRSVIACFYYLEFARGLLQGEDKWTVYRRLQAELPGCLEALSINGEDVALFGRLLQEDISAAPESSIGSSGYVLHTLEATIWSLLTTDRFDAAVLRAVNLGEDTDTTGAVTGGLAALLYGGGAIPTQWVESLARIRDIEALAARCARALAAKQS
jgi:ADP-ribosyl-[dinitrogen reductase] hydrolase